MSARTPRPVAAAEIAPVLDEMHTRLTAGVLDAEHVVQVHEFLDIDPDIADRTYPPMPHARAGVYPDTSSPEDCARSVRDGFEPPVVWDDTPDCQPALVTAPARTVADVQTGGRL